MIKFQALVVEEIEDGKFIRSVKEKEISSIPENHLLIKVKYSSLNYKDALSARGHKGISRNYPHTPGIDAAGIIAESKSDIFKSGDEVIVTGYDLGMNTNGGFGQYIVVPADWAVRLPKGLSLEESMIYGTAGFTAAICIYELQKHDITPEKGKILVTGATGGVGSMAVGLLANLGYEVTASTGKAEHHDFLKSLGATEIISREMIDDNSGRPLLSGKWIGAVDNVGGNTLATVIKSIGQHGCICVLGNVAGDKFTSTVYPFLLRGIILAGIDSASRPMELRKILWEKLAGDWKFHKLNDTYKIVTLDKINDEIDNILKGEQVGRVVLNLW
ncbi:MAG: YhdH/YhfP family quinone oxidoreductase [Candidatus Kapabacteria bacterium]|nr:YhdH/YhfP family quinone oxidoreductase [Ignavibacteriota bacterium]MCW5884535.1 YhdH/YhfP family quinone oxidoreductase [Candidatus Kapabacteria bacterium]